MNLPDQFHLFASEAKASGSPLYGLAAARAVDDPEILALTENRRTGQPAPNLLFAAVHFELLSGADHPLKDYYPSCGGTKRAEEGDAYALFRAFTLERKDRITATVARRVTNTNEVARSAILYPAYDWIAHKTGVALQILEIGPSAGLNLNWHRYGYRYKDEAGRIVLERGANRALVLPSVLKGAGRPQLAEWMPEVARIRGLELNPVVIADPAERLWLKALIWPERLDRLARLEPALAISARHPPEIVAGNAVHDLPRALSVFDGALPVIVAHTAVTYQFSKEDRAAFQAALAAAARGIHLYEVGMEWMPDSGHTIEVTEHTAEPVKRHVLGRTDPHANWIEWI